MALVKRFINDTSGSTAIEFAFVFPVFITMILGILEFGVMAYLRGAIEEVTRSSARIAITGGIVGSDPDVSRTDALTDLIQQRTQSVVVGNGNIEISQTAHSSIANYVSSTGGVAGVGGGNAIVEYVVRYNYQFFTPLAALVETISGDVVLTSTAVVQNENF